MGSEWDNEEQFPITVRANGLGFIETIIKLFKNLFSRMCHFFIEATHLFGVDDTVKVVGVFSPHILCASAVRPMDVIH